MSKVLVIFLGLMASGLWAHTGVNAIFTVTEGFMHPISGMDHILAMFAVGLFASLFTQKDVVKVLIAFVGMMGVSAAIGTFHLAIPFIEAGIVGSIVVFGLMIVFAAKIPYRIALAAVGIFAMFHGYAHGYEFSGSGSFAGYLAGFSVSTLTIHLMGLGVGRFVQMVALDSSKNRVIKAAGSAIALGGLSLSFL